MCLIWCTSLASRTSFCIRLRIVAGIETADPRLNGTMAARWSFARRVVGMVAAWLLLLPGLAVAASALTSTADFETKAPYAILMDYESGAVIYQKAADEPVEPASMAKLMTLAVVFDQLKTGRIHLDDQFFISEHAWRDGGAASGSSTMFAKLNSKVPVQDLLYGVIVQSGNDAAIALAEGIAGSESTFANMENQMSRQIGLTESHWTNASGLPDPAMHTTVHDLAVLARYLIKNYPEYYHIFSEKEFTWNKIKQPNRNSLLEMGIGVDGLKTGHSEEAGGERFAHVNHPVTIPWSPRGERNLTRRVNVRSFRPIFCKECPARVDSQSCLARYHRGVRYDVHAGSPGAAARPRRDHRARFDRGRRGENPRQRHAGRQGHGGGQRQPDRGGSGGIAAARARSAVIAGIALKFLSGPCRSGGDLLHGPRSGTARDGFAPFLMLPDAAVAELVDALA